MEGLNRIEYEGFSKEYVMQRLQIALEPDSSEVWQTETKPLPPMVMNSEQARDRILQARKGIFRIAVRLAFRFKAVVKRVPFLGKAAVRIKNDYLAEAYENQTRREKDLTSLLSLDINDFLRSIYHELLEREPDTEGFAAYQRLICKGAPRGAVVYLISTSSEFAGKFRITNLKAYKKSYKHFALKAKIKKIPIVGWCIQLQNMQGYFAEMRAMDADRRTKERMFQDALHTMQTDLLLELRNKEQALREVMLEVKQMQESFQNNEKFDILEQLPKDLDWFKYVITSLSEKVDSVHQKLDNISQPEMPYLPEYLIVNGSLDEDSYLDHANAILREESPEQLTEGNYYQLLQALFRGSEENIKKHQQYYLDYMLSNYKLQQAEGQYFLDAGCGRGEFLELLIEQGVSSKGIDIDKINIDYLTGKGFSVYRADILKYLNSIDDNELTGLSSFQVIEHLPKEYVDEMINIAFKKIANNGVILLETINPYCYSQQGKFYIDPTHSSWHSPDNLKLRMEYVGFKDVKIIYYAPVSPSQASKTDIQSNYAGYAVIASVLKS